jgi:hypothetical protein
LLVLLLLRLELLSSGDETALVSSLRLTVTSSLISTSVSSLLITTSITTLLVAPLLAVITSGLLLLLSVGVVRVGTGLTSLLLSRLTGLTRTRNKVAAGDELISSRVHFFSRYDPGSMSM